MSQHYPIRIGERVAVIQRTATVANVLPAGIRATVIALYRNGQHYAIEILDAPLEGCIATVSAEAIQSVPT